MDKTTFQSIADSEEFLTRYANLPQRLRAIAGVVTGKSHKELLAIAKELEDFDLYPNRLFKLHLARAYCIRRSCLSLNQPKSIADLAHRLDTSESTVRQTLCALNTKGDGKLQLSNRQKTRRISARRSENPGNGPAATNENRSNEERLEESIEAVKSAVSILKRQHSDWASKSARSKIELLQQETLKTRGARISSQTLYRPSIRFFW